MNFAFYKDLVRTGSFSAEFTALLDNAFNHPQFSVGLGTGGFMDLTDYLIDGFMETARRPRSTPIPSAARRDSRLVV